MLKLDILMVPIYIKVLGSAHMRPGKYRIEIAADMLRAMVSEIGAQLRVPFKRDGGHVAMAHDDLAKVIDAVVCPLDLLAGTMKLLVAWKTTRLHAPVFEMVDDDAAVRLKWRLVPKIHHEAISNIRKVSLEKVKWAFEFYICLPGSAVGETVQSRQCIR